MRRNKKKKSLYKIANKIYTNGVQNLVDNNVEGKTREEEIIMTELLQKMEQLQIPPHILRELGLGKDWVKKLTPEFKQQVVKAAIKHRETLKELSKY